MVEKSLCRNCDEGDVNPREYTKLVLSAGSASGFVVYLSLSIYIALLIRDLMLCGG
ncbi:hypothetical protein M2263_000193 [Providencia alcalifaciens]|nr:hypothetical protein [Providencia alcalifaciens]